jgi:hypothetical protein
MTIRDLFTMTIRDLFSKRQKRLRGEIPDIYQYDVIPTAFRVQVAHIWQDAFGTANAFDSKTDEVYRTIHDSLAREYGLFVLSPQTAEHSHKAGLFDFLLTSGDTERVLDAIEMSFSVIDSYCREWEFYGYSHPTITPDQAIAELNARFKENGLGYQFENGQIIRVDSTIMHADVVRPTLTLLSDPAYAGPNAEFLAAHEHYRHGRYKESLNDSLKAFESTLKTICKKRGWTYDPTDTAKKLLDVCFANSLLPPYLQSQYSSLRTLLESAVPTLRNKTSGHGQGAQPVALPQHVAAYGLHLAAASILFVVTAEKALP